MINEATTAVAAFENGEIDFQQSLPPADMDRIKALPTYHQTPSAGVYYYGFNTKHAPLDKLEVRQALALAIDRQAIIDNVTKGGQLPATSFIPKGTPGWDSYQYGTILKPTADVAAAKDLLAKAGYPDGQGLPEIVILYNTNQGHQAIATAIQAQWQAIGVKSTLKNMEWKQFNAFLKDNLDQVMVYRMGWIADFNDAYNYFDLMRSTSGNNHTNWGDPTFDADLPKSLQAPDDASRWAIYKEMNQILGDQMPLAPIYWYTNQYLLKDYVKGFEINPMAMTTYLAPVYIAQH